jgi:hypothetical protein
LIGKANIPLSEKSSEVEALARGEGVRPVNKHQLNLEGPPG